ncbi:MAG: hypothetical protein K8R25_11175 [Methanosarcinales archaeon]|nr:hypothetical protein [Methanosarcinales archaeon]
MINFTKQVPDTNNQVLQNFISDSPWDEKPLINQLQKELIKLIGDKKAPMLSMIDVKEILEVIMPKKDLTEKEILSVIRQKHKDRLSARKSPNRRGG